ncbi:MAG: hypothetical protein LC649_05490 [Bacteroidales bacterium]|nr:hypothetical protein [Bacteroidales bacterium]
MKGNYKPDHCRNRDQDIAVMLILFFLFVTASLAILSKGSHGGEDDISHYRIARLAFSTPELFLDLWGKPLYTIPASLFARFGYNGVKIMNVLLSALTLFVSYRSATLLKLRYPWATVILAGCAPVYLALSYSGMTEIIFSLLAVTSVWALLRGRYVLMILLLSFLPFARSEGFVLWIPVIVALIIEKKQRLIPFLATGFIFFSVIGLPFFDDLFWIIHRFPYGGSNLYGSGSLFFFAGKLPLITGLVMLFPLLAAMISLAASGKKKFIAGGREYNLVWYVMLPALFYFGAHSIVWWLGRGNSAGLIRVMAAIIPLLAIASLYGVDRLASFLESKSISPLPFVILLVAGVAWEGWSRNHHPASLSGEQLLIKDAVNWLRNETLAHSRVYYYNPFYLVLSGVDPADTHMAIEKVPDPFNPAAGVGAGEFILWDSHFSPAEGRLPESRLAESGEFNLLASFGSGYGEVGDPRVALWQRVIHTDTALNSIKGKLSLSFEDSDTTVIEFSSFTGLQSEKYLTGSDGSSLYLLERGDEFSPSLNLPAEMNGDAVTGVRIRGDAIIRVDEDLESDEVLLILSLDSNGEPVVYNKQDFSLFPAEEGWISCTISIETDSRARKDDTISLYIWNKGKRRVYIKSFRAFVYSCRSGE